MYFAGVMVRLMLTLTPVVCILAGIAFSGLLDLHMQDEQEEHPVAINRTEDTQPNKNLYDKVYYLNLNYAVKFDVASVVGVITSKNHKYSIY